MNRYAMTRGTPTLPLLLVLLFVAACANPEPGADALTNIVPTPYWDNPYNPGLFCEDCHLANDAINPLVLDTTLPVTNPGKHATHVTIKAIPCAACHWQRDQDPQHSDGTLTRADASATLVVFNGANPTASWQDSTGSCANTNCHAITGVVPQGPVVDWYAP